MIRNPYHYVQESCWPVYTALSIFTTVIGFVMVMHSWYDWLFFLGITLLLLCMYYWMKSIVFEGVAGCHSEKVAAGLRFAIVMFILSEVMFFVSFFWGYFHSSLSPSIQIGCVWPPEGIVPIDPYGEPLLNTVLLLTSGCFVTYGHHALMVRDFKGLSMGLFFALVFGLVFTAVQVMEYYDAHFCIADGIYGSMFYMLTGLHGFHVIVGSIFLAVSLYRSRQHSFLPRRHVGLELAVWYWHFVDVVWIMLFLSVYCWGSWGV